MYSKIGWFSFENTSFHLLLKWYSNLNNLKMLSLHIILKIIYIQNYCIIEEQYGEQWACLVNHPVCYIYYYGGENAHDLYSLLLIVIIIIIAR